MLIYDFWAELRNWHPRQVDELYLDELEDLPIVREAREAALEIIQKQKG